MEDFNEYGYIKYFQISHCRMEEALFEGLSIWNDEIYKKSLRKISIPLSFTRHKRDIITEENTSMFVALNDVYHSHQIFIKSNLIL